MNYTFDADSNYTLTLITHNCQMNKKAKRLSLKDNKKFMAITCMQEPIDVIAEPRCGFRYTSEEVSCRRKDWSVFGIFAEFDSPIKLRLLNVHLNPRPWPEPGFQRSYDLRKITKKKKPHIIMGDFNELRNGPCDKMLLKLGYTELSSNISDPTWFSAEEDNQNIDRIYCKKSLLRFINYECRLGERYYSDHTQVICSISPKYTSS